MISGLEYPFQTASLAISWLWKVSGEVISFGAGQLIPKGNQKTIFVILSAAKNLSFKDGEILHSTALRSE